MTLLKCRQLRYRPRLKGRRDLQFFWSRKKQLAEVQDEHGIIRVEQKGSIRYLVFGETSEQSAVCMRKPLLLQYQYSRAMLLAALCHPQPETALFMGLGSGALVRSCLAAMPELFDAEIIELRPKVLQLAQDYMGFTVDERMTIRLGDGWQLLDTAEDADLIFLDMYNEEGPSLAHVAKDFLTRCQARLAANGWLIINQWQFPGQRPLGHNVFCKLFKGGYWELPVSEGNVILLVPANPTEKLPVQRLRERAREVSLQQGYDLSGLLMDIRVPG